LGCRTGYPDSRKSSWWGSDAIGAIIGTPEVWTAFDENPLIHSSTFGGNELASRVALEALKVIIEEKLPQQAQEKGEWFIPKIKKIASEYGDLVEEVRGIGLFIGVDFKNDDIGNLFLSALAARKVIVAFALNSAKVIRIEPPLNIPKELLEIVLVKFRESLEEVRTIIKSMD
jgi:putrescine aminotransferase